MFPKYVKIGEAARKTRLSKQTMRRYALDGTIEFIKTPGGHRLFDVSALTGEQQLEDDNEAAIEVCYCRVSTHGQKDDLCRQVAHTSEKYPDYEVITDIGSGINFNRPGLRKIINYAITGELKTLVVAYKDRLCRIWYDLIEYILIEYSNTEIISDHEVEESLNEEIANDILQIVTVYSTKINDMRKYSIAE